ncbi:MAG TPA: toll/interleukin-1 receptor domain-containing protein [Caldisericia bacterium]|nr:toll/interleukin-1 receptor domain-containing protein [Caldisericia bacterium]HPF49191.1 toll/interleukin-1 receptor domain-containing protein [Caldisericia bacterium]HPI84130.1 toll/interleukin-1 receptor domain-containing protein [Caldisericia bacterium]HPQ93387.1 toll/interleukin-1 receptor domain-containing protein [Caldisericia bacterium]HRV75231.1 toll/interleukin-1 receptor domain-containing protein [Caldisericia bacterium]
MGEKKWDVFISASKRNKSIVSELKDILERDAISYFWFEDTIEYAGQDNLSKCLNAINASRNFVAIITEDYYNSNLCIEEIKYARNSQASKGDINVYPFRFESSVDFNRLPVSVRDIDIPLVCGVNEVRKFLLQKIRTDKIASQTFGDNMSDILHTKNGVKIQDKIYIKESISLTSFIGDFIKEYPHVKRILQKYGRLIETVIDTPSKNIRVSSTQFINRNIVLTLSFQVYCMDFQNDFVHEIEKKAIMFKDELHIVFTKDPVEKFSSSRSKMEEDGVLSRPIGAGYNGMLIFIYAPKECDEVLLEDRIKYVINKYIS